ncbi:MAG: hypothetical protein MUC38_11275 [Cyclobacteriaceae bacterium]|jgi:hypothetical protein|nr:hypothetical protein [Cyclobacteriaceae bacterium]
MKHLIVWLCVALPWVVAGQRKPSKENAFEGIIDKYMASGIAYDVIQLRAGKNFRYVKFDSRSGKELMAKFPVGTEVSGMAKGRSHEFKSLGKLSIFVDFLADSLISMNGGGHAYQQTWVPRKKFVHPLAPSTHANHSVLLDRKIIATASHEDMGKLLYIDQETVLVSKDLPYNRLLRPMTKGDVVSAIILPIDLHEGEAYPVRNFSKGYHAEVLGKFEGIIESFLYKQNTACVGMKVNSGTRSMQFQFRTDMAEQIMQWQKRQEPILVYYRPRVRFDYSPLLDKPSIHAIISRTDTLRVVDDYFGGPDGTHDYVAVSGTGKISSVKTSLAGKAYGLVVDEKYFVEIDKKTEAQLKKYFRNRVPISFEGKQRVKKPGEVYQGNYEIITPTKLMIADKEFLVIAP